VEHGPNVIARVREEKPDIYLKVVASILPRELHVKDQSTFDGKTNEQLDDILGSVRAALAARTPTGVGGGKLRRAAKTSLISFTEFAYPRYEAAAIHKQIAEQLERIERGEIDRLMLLVPPRHGKSELASRRFPAWFLGRHPDKQFISASASATLAEDFGRDVRNLIASQEYAQVFDTRLSEDAQARGRWTTQQGGSYFATGVGGAIMGRGARAFLIDDPFGSMAVPDPRSNASACMSGTPGP